MKYILILHLCSMITGKCVDPFIPGYQFKTHYDCAIAGYGLSQKSLKELANDENYGLETINRDKLAIRFECKGLDNA
jgi:hypothetical protein